MNDFKNKKKFIAILIVVVVFAVAWKAFVYRSSFPRPDSRGWQAVFLTNDQVYFGKLWNYSREYAVLEQIFSLRVAEPLQAGEVVNRDGENVTLDGFEGLHGHFSLIGRNEVGFGY